MRLLAHILGAIVGLLMMIVGVYLMGAVAVNEVMAGFFVAIIGALVMTVSLVE